jgi:chromosome segregation ATPase
MKKVVVIALLVSSFDVVAMQADEKGKECMKQLEALEACLNSLLPNSTLMENAINDLNTAIAKIQPSNRSEPEGSIPNLNTKIKSLNEQLDGVGNQAGLREQERVAQENMRWFKGEPGAAVPARMANYKSLAAMREQLAEYSSRPRVQGDVALRARIAALEGQVGDALKRIRVAEEKRDKARNPAAVVAPQAQTQGWGNRVWKMLGWGQ